MKKTELQKALATIAPSISIRTIWEHDEDCRDIRKHCDGMENEDPDDWQAWQSNVCAVAIIDGDEIEGNAYLGGTWEKAGDVPEESNPEISGYENQMTVEALEELGREIVKSGDCESGLLVQIVQAVAHCKAESAKTYAAQMAESK
jgi:hypothetical protein